MYWVQCAFPLLSDLDTFAAFLQPREEVQQNRGMLALVLMMIGGAHARAACL